MDSLLIIPRDGSVWIVVRLQHRSGAAMVQATTYATPVAFTTKWMAWIDPSNSKEEFRQTGLGPDWSVLIVAP